MSNIIAFITGHATAFSTALWQGYALPAAGKVAGLAQSIQLSSRVSAAVASVFHFAATPLGMGLIGAVALAAVIGWIVLKPNDVPTSTPLVSPPGSPPAPPHRARPRRTGSGAGSRAGSRAGSAANSGASPHNPPQTKRSPQASSGKSTPKQTPSSPTLSPEQLAANMERVEKQAGQTTPLKGHKGAKTYRQYCTRKGIKPDPQTLAAIQNGSAHVAHGVYGEDAINTLKRQGKALDSTTERALRNGEAYVKLSDLKVVYIDSKRTA